MKEKRKGRGSKGGRCGHEEEEGDEGEGEEGGIDKSGRGVGRKCKTG